MIMSKTDPSKLKGAFSLFIDRHPVFATLVLAMFVCGCLLVLFWFVVFSGLSQTADFIYAKF